MGKFRLLPRDSRFPRERMGLAEMQEQLQREPAALCIKLIAIVAPRGEAYKCVGTVVSPIGVGSLPPFLIPLHQVCNRGCHAR